MAQPEDVRAVLDRPVLAFAAQQTIELTARLLKSRWRGCGLGGRRLLGLRTLDPRLSGTDTLVDLDRRVELLYRTAWLACGRKRLPP